jgi:5-methylcytosine-specific restriction endonuclease McrA
MDRDRLEGYLEQGLSLAQIGALENRDPTTVSYWLKKYGLEVNGREAHAARGALSIEVLQPLVERGLTLTEIASELDRSVAAVRYWLEKHGLRTKRRRGPRPAIPREVVDDAIARGLRTLEGDCRHHGRGIFVIENSGRVRCRQCRMDRVAERRRKVKRILIEEAGGSCVRCGYDRFVGALQFHHVDPAEKSFGVAQKGATIGIDSLRAEAAKCIVLCANCHAEVEHGNGGLALK